MTDPALERWRLILGRPASQCLGNGDSEEVTRRDAALDWLYGRDEDLRKRGIRRGGAGDSVLSTMD